MWLFRHARDADTATFDRELVVIGLATLPFFCVAACLAAVIAPALVTLVVATMRLSYLVVWLNQVEAALFQGPNKPVYLAAYRFFSQGSDQADHAARLAASRSVVSSKSNK